MKQMYGDSDDLLVERGFIKPCRETVFPSLCDWLDEEVSVEWLADFLILIHRTPCLNWLLLTKRPENWTDRMAEVGRWLSGGPPQEQYHAEWIEAWESGDRVPDNVWVGTSVEDQNRADERIPELLRIPAELRFLSVEPLLGPVDLMTWIGDHEDRPTNWGEIDWVIVGGESGPRSRPCNVDWIRSIMQQCDWAQVPCFVKQLGAHVVDERANSADFVPGKECWPEGAAVDGCRVILKHPKGGDPAEWPEDLRVRQFPV